MAYEMAYLMDISSERVISLWLETMPDDTGKGGNKPQIAL
jgi:hypothetical protein